MCLAVIVAGCGGGQGHGGLSRTGASLPQPRLADSRPCARIAGFTCATLTVPLDHAAQAAGTLRLAVAVQHSGAAPRGTLLFLTGGPGQPGVDLIPKVRARLGGVLSDYRLVMFDQRGTGAGALDCPALQAAAGSSDLVVVAGDAVPACARRLGTSRRYFTTPETVADIDSLRTALGVQKLTLDGVSYGTLVAERYALAHPRRVAALVLDSVVPQTGVDPLYLASVQATARVLRAACAAQHCGSDPAADLAALIRAGEDGPRLQDAIVAESIAFPNFAHVPEILHAAREGRPAALNAFLAGVARGEAAPAPALSQGLHESTLCLDLAPPWNPVSSRAARAAVLSDAGARLPSSAFFPFSRASAVGNGLARNCLQWPPTEPPAVGPVDPAGLLPRVPVLLLAGGRDLSTPLAWARAEAVHAPDRKLIVVPDAGHSVQLRAGNVTARQALARFLAGES